MSYPQVPRSVFRKLPAGGRNKIGRVAREAADHAVEKGLITPSQAEKGKACGKMALDYYRAQKKNEGGDRTRQGHQLSAKSVSKQVLKTGWAVGGPQVKRWLLCQGMQA